MSSQELSEQEEFYVKYSGKTIDELVETLGKDREVIEACIAEKAKDLYSTNEKYGATVMTQSGGHIGDELLKKIKKHQNTPDYVHKPNKNKKSR